MIDENHSYCSKKISLSSQPPTNSEIEMIVGMHNQERADVNAKDMQKMVRENRIQQESIEFDL